MARLAVVGAGMMGEALVRGLLAAGWSPDDVVLADVRAERLAELEEALGCPTRPTGAEAAAEAEGVLLAVKPQEAPDAVGELAGDVGAQGLVSIVAGMRIATISEHLGDDTSIVRAMPNSPARVGKGVTALAAAEEATEATRELAGAIFSVVGPVIWLDESKLDAVTALSGSGPAYVFLLAEALVEAGVALGLTREVAETLTFSTIEGAGTMLVTSGESPTTLRTQVTSPAGTTAAALGVLEATAVRAAFAEAVRAAYRRSRELAE